MPPKHSESGKAWPKDSKARTNDAKILNRNTRRLMRQIEGMADSLDYPAKSAPPAPSAKKPRR